jgi:hypothetical protein
MTGIEHRLRGGAALLLALLAPALVASGGCAATSGGAPGSPPARSSSAADYYPLDPGWKWAYDLEKDGQKMLALYAVVERSADTAVIQAGDDRLTYAVTAEGVAQKEGTMIGDFVIKNPVAAGTQWPVTGGVAKIVAIEQEITVDAGKFSHCAVVEVARNDPGRLVRTTFAPGVGPVAIELQIQFGGSLVTVTRAALRAITRPGEDPLR